MDKWYCGNRQHGVFAQRLLESPPPDASAAACVVNELLRHPSALMLHVDSGCEHFGAGVRCAIVKGEARRRKRALTEGLLFSA